MPVHNILLVSYLFPPCGGVGVQRALGYARYLPDNDCRTTVLTPSNPVSPLMDPSLLDSWPSQVQVERTFTPEIPYTWRERFWSKVLPPKPGAQPKAASEKAALPTSSLKTLIRSSVERVYSPDAQRFWFPFAVRRGSQLIESQGIDTVLVTTPPYSSLRIGTELKRRHPHICLVTEFRDEWIHHYLSGDRSTSAFRLKRALQIEGDAIAASDLVMAVTDMQIADIRNRYPNQPDSKFVCLPNGFDPHAFRGFSTAGRSATAPQDRLIVTYTGTVYANPLYSIRPYLDAVDSLPEEIRNGIETRFIGRIADGQESMLANRKSKVTVLGFLPHGEAIRQLEEAHLLLLPVNSMTSHANKLFEYLATRRPILALTPPGSEVSKLMAKTGAGWCANPDDLDNIATTVQTAMRACRFEPSQIPQRNESEIVKFSRPELVRQLVEMVSTIKRNQAASRK